MRERLCGDLQQPIAALAWSADGEFLAIASTGGELLLLDFRAGCEELLRGDHDSSLDVLGFSGDGQFLMAAGQGGELLLWELGGTGVRPMVLDPIPLGCGWIDAAAWQPRGLLLALAAGCQVRLWDGASRQWLDRRLELPGTVQALAWSADGSSLAASCNGELAAWVPQAAPELAPLRQPIASAGLALAFAPVGGLLALGQLDRSLLLWPEGGRGTPWQFSGFPAKVRRLAWSDCRGRLAPALAVASAETLVLWTQQQPAGQRQRRWHRGALGWRRRSAPGPGGRGAGIQRPGLAPRWPSPGGRRCPGALVAVAGGCAPPRAVSVPARRGYGLWLSGVLPTFCWGGAYASASPGRQRRSGVLAAG